METWKKIENEKFFDRLSQTTKSYVWIDEGNSYTIVDGVYYSRTQKGVDDFREITTTKFHNRVQKTNISNS